MTNQLELERFYNPPVESARTDSAEAQLKRLNGKSPVGQWIKGRYNGIPVSGFVLKVMGYGIISVHWVKGSTAFSQEISTVGLHGNKFYFYNKEMDLKKADIKELIDFTLRIKDFDWTRELIEHECFK